MRHLRRVLLWLGLDLLFVLGFVGFTVWADSCAKLRQVPVQKCYCGCNMSKTAAGCGKMCEIPKYASRRWAVTCAKPRTSGPNENPGAGPRFPRPGRSERAAN